MALQDPFRVASRHFVVVGVSALAAAACLYISSVPLERMCHLGVGDACTQAAMTHRIWQWLAVSGLGLLVVAFLMSELGPTPMPDRPQAPAPPPRRKQDAPPSEDPADAPTLPAIPVRIPSAAP